MEGLVSSMESATTQQIVVKRLRNSELLAV